MNNFRRELIILGVLFVVMCAVSGYFYIQMENSGVDKVPIHWNVHNQPDNFAPPIIAALIGPAVILLMIFAAWSMANKKYSDPEKRSVKFIILLVASVFVFLNWVALKAASGYGTGEGFDISLIHIGLGLVFVLIGNQLGKLPQSHWVGIRVPATLNNEEVWNRVHRKSGRLMVISGLLVLVAAFFGPRNWTWVFYIPLFISMIVIIFVLPSFEKKKLDKEK